MFLKHYIHIIVKTFVFFVLIDCYGADDPHTGDCYGLHSQSSKISYKLLN